MLNKKGNNISRRQKMPSTLKKDKPIFFDIQT